MYNMYKLMTGVCLVAFAVFLSGCGTVAGVGKDIQKVGSTLEKEAKKDDKKPASTY